MYKLTCSILSYVQRRLDISASSVFTAGVPDTGGALVWERLRLSETDMMQIYRASVEPVTRRRSSLRNVIRKHLEIDDKQPTGRCSPAETAVIERTKTWIRARGGIVNSRNIVIRASAMLDEPSP